MSSKRPVKNLQIIIVERNYVLAIPLKIAVSANSASPSPRRTAISPVLRVNAARARNSDSDQHKTWRYQASYRTKNIRRRAIQMIVWADRVRRRPGPITFRKEKNEKASKARPAR
jgi:hypothetical protein